MSTDVCMSLDEQNLAPMCLPALCFVEHGTFNYAHGKNYLYRIMLSYKVQKRYGVGKKCLQTIFIRTF